MEKFINENKKWIDEVWEKLDKKLRPLSVTMRNKMPAVAADGVYNDRSKENINEWTNGFWGGIMWLMYNGTKAEDYMITARTQEEMLDGALRNYKKLDHDLGFMWMLTSGYDYKLTGDEAAETRTLYAASVLASRYNPLSKFIRAWNWENSEGGIIIDCMMNLPLLYWASEQIDDTRFKNVAIGHADTTIRTHIRDDGSAGHIVVVDPETGEIVREGGGQGYELGSSWSRGQSWALYGFTLSYKHTGLERYLNVAKKSANYFISCVCDDYVPRCDFRAPAEPVIYDTSAGAIAACGLIELAGCVAEFEKPTYINAAINILKAIDKEHCTWDENSEAILKNVTSMYHAVNSKNTSIIYGDYYFVEAISRLKGFNIEY